MIVASVDGDAGAAGRALAGVAGVDRVDVHGDEVTVGVPDGSAALSPVAVALAGSGARVRNLVLRTPTLDDVFLALTGDRMSDAEPVPDHVDGISA